MQIIDQVDITFLSLCLTLPLSLSVPKASDGMSDIPQPYCAAQAGHVHVQASVTGQRCHAHTQQKLFTLRMV